MIAWHSFLVIIMIIIIIVIIMISKRSIFDHGIKIWNNLSPEVKSITNKRIFKKMIRKKLINEK